MPTYVQKDTDSDLSPFGAFNKELSAGTGSDAAVTVSGINPGSPTTGGFITPAGVPNSDLWEDSGTWTVEVEVDTGNMQLDCRVRCVRLNSGGTVLQSGAYTAAQGLTVSRTFSPVRDEYVIARTASWTGFSVKWTMLCGLTFLTCHKSVTLLGPRNL